MKILIKILDILCCDMVIVAEACFLTFIVGVQTGADGLRKEAIEHKAAMYIKDNKGDDKFVWKLDCGCPNLSEN